MTLFPPVSEKDVQLLIVTSCREAVRVSVKLCSPAIPKIYMSPDHRLTFGGMGGWKSINDKFENIGFNRKYHIVKPIDLSA